MNERLLETKLLLLPIEVAEILRVSRRRVYSLCEDEILDVIKIGHSIRIKPESVRQILEKRLNNISKNRSQIIMRKCLKCDKEFKAKNRFNRICPKCTRASHSLF